MEDFSYWKNRKIDDERRDWQGNSKTWLQGYWDSAFHCHRNQLIKELSKLKFNSLLEIGCNVGANISRIRSEFNIEDNDLAGIDINEDAIQFAQKKMPDVLFRIGNILERLPFENKSYDIVLADAVLMYVEPEKIDFVLDEMNRVAKKAIILCDWDKEENGERIKDFHWCYNYKFLLEKFGFKVNKIKITKWPTKSGNWERNGWIFVAARQ